MDIVPIPMTREEFETVVMALNSTEDRYRRLAETEPHLRERAEKIRRVYEKVVFVYECLPRY